MKHIGAIFLLVALLVPAFGADARILCGIRNEMAAKLADKYQEEPKGMGMTNSGGVLEVFTSPRGTWTIIVTMPDKTADGKLKACLIAHGESWEKLPTQYGTNGKTS